MDWNDQAESKYNAIRDEWLTQLIEARPVIQEWLSKLNDNRRCHVIDYMAGSFNYCIRVAFVDIPNAVEQWILRIPMAGKSMNIDEKTIAEAATLQFLKERTCIPVPRIISWGTRLENPMPVFGAHIIMEFVEGVNLGNIVYAGLKRGEERRFCQDITDEKIRRIYRGMANILLELSVHKFSKIGGLVLLPPRRVTSVSIHLDSVVGDIDEQAYGDKRADSQESKLHSPQDSNQVQNRYIISSSPLTKKSNETERTGGVVIYDRFEGPFSSTTEYCKHVARQDHKHLLAQPNSVPNPKVARAELIHAELFSNIIPHFVSSRYDKQDFRLFCEDIHYGNILVNNAEDFEIVAVVDWEWTFAAPYQFLYSPPRWLIGSDPTEWAYRGIEKEAELRSDYQLRFEKFHKVLVELEDERLADGRDVLHRDEPRFSTLMSRSMDDGTFWFNELVLGMFKTSEDVAWNELRRCLPDLDGMQNVSEDEIEYFATVKMRDLERYEKEMEAQKLCDSCEVKDGNLQLDYKEHSWRGRSKE